MYELRTITLYSGGNGASAVGHYTACVFPTSDMMPYYYNDMQMECPNTPIQPLQPKHLQHKLLNYAIYFLDEW